jgi:release factor glutamine methyltransferase
MLKEAGIENAVFEAKQIIYYITKYTSAQILERYNEQLDEVKRSLWVVTVKQRCTGYPLQYILGEWDFYGLRFFVGEGCLVPRSDTETLVAKALDFLEGKENPEVLDLCAGSGCIGITVANKIKDSKVTLIGRGYQGRHNDDSPSINSWFFTRYQNVIQSQFRQKDKNNQ